MIPITSLPASIKHLFERREHDCSSPLEILLQRYTAAGKQLGDCTKEDLVNEAERLDKIARGERVKANFMRRIASRMKPNQKVRQVITSTVHFHRMMTFAEKQTDKEKAVA